MNSTINGYLIKLSDNLKSLPEEERESIIKEIEIHLKDKVTSLKNEGYSDKEAVNKMLSEFKSPYTLANEYLNEYDDSKVKDRPNVTFFLLNIGLMGLGLLSLPILEKDLIWIILGGAEAICGLIVLLIINQKKMYISIFLKIAPKILLSLLFPASLLFYWIAFNQNNGFVSFSLYYMFIYWLILLIYYLIIRKTSQRIK